jgi:ligand-binding SRPBCC domain-containing protein
MISNELNRRITRINRSPFAQEVLRLPIIIDLIANLTREVATASNMTGADDILIDIAANALAWAEYRKFHREAKEVKLIDSVDMADRGKI